MRKSNNLAYASIDVCLTGGVMPYVFYPPPDQNLIPLLSIISAKVRL